jgi:Uma2 family endonuclease
MSTALAKIMTLDQFLAWEEKQELKYEFSHGEVRLMTGSTVVHDTVRGAIFASFWTQLKGKPCKVHIDIKIVCPSGNVRYPDVAVDCGSNSQKNTRLVAPTVVVEVLSPSTQMIDYTLKSRDYASVPSIDAYLLVNPNEPQVDVMRRTEIGFLPVEQYSALEDVIDLPSIGVSLKLSDIYAE